MRGAGAVGPGVRLALVVLASAAPTAPAWSQSTAAPAAPLPAAPAAAQRPPVHGYEIVAEYPHDPEAFTQGLVVRDGVFLESTGQHPSSVRRVRIEDGAVQMKRELERDLFGEGLTELDGKVYSLTWRHEVGFVWDARTLEPLRQFTYAGEGWGLTHDGSRLILSDGSSRLRFLDPETFQETGSVSVQWRGSPLERLNELEFIEGEVWANVWQSELILRIDPADGQVKSVVDLRGLAARHEGLDPADDVLNGIAWDAQGRRLFVTGKRWPKVYEIRLTGPH